MAGLTQERLKEIISYDEETGSFFWFKTGRGRRNDLLAGTPHNKGYWMICIDKKTHLAHRLAWLYVNGKFPEHELDHINGDRLDNRIKNLRCVTKKQNMENLALDKRNKSGVRGVCWSEERKKWIAQIHHNGKVIPLGRFDSLVDAAAKRMSANAMFYTHIDLTGVRHGGTA